jgi:hypothetical protein
MRPRVEKFSRRRYTLGCFLNFLARNALFIPIANATAVFAWRLYQKKLQNVYILMPNIGQSSFIKKMAGYQLLPCEYIGSGYNIDNGTENYTER